MLSLHSDHRYHNARRAGGQVAGVCPVALVPYQVQATARTLLASRVVSEYWQYGVWEYIYAAKRK